MSRGVCATAAARSALTQFAKPGPRVTLNTPVRPVERAYPIAPLQAVSSCRVLISRSVPCCTP